FMLKSVQRDRPTARLPLAYALPKISRGRVHAERWIPVVRHHGHDGLELVLNQRCFDFSPDLPVHSRADVVKSQEILGSVWGLHGHCILKSSWNRPMRFRLG